MTDQQLKTTIESGRDVVTVVNGSTEDAKSMHAAQVLIAREVDAFNYDSAIGVVESMNRVTHACRVLERLVGESVDPMNVIDVDRLTRAEGEAPEGAVAWWPHYAVIENPAEGAKVAPWVLVER